MLRADYQPKLILGALVLRFRQSFLMLITKLNYNNINHTIKLMISHTHTHSTRLLLVTSQFFYFDLAGNVQVRQRRASAAMPQSDVFVRQTEAWSTVFYAI